MLTAYEILVNYETELDSALREVQECIKALEANEDYGTPIPKHIKQSLKRLIVDDRLNENIVEDYYNEGHNHV